MDARSLLRAKKAESRIDHPYAAYSATGQLRCSICAIPVKQWDAHLLTKQHRASVTREKTSASTSQSKFKRPAEGDSTESTKRARTSGSDDVVRSSILPAGFFSGGSGPKIIGAEEDDEEQEEEEEDRPTMKAGPSTSASVAPQASTAAASASAAAGQTGDEELDSFLASIAEPDPIIETSEEPPAPAPTAATQKAALGSTKKPTTSSYRDIIPGQASYEAAPVRNIPKDQEEQVAEPEVEESEAEKRARIAREEREEIMNRLEEEERAQEDGDSRVAALKQRMEMLKKRREAKAKAKAS